jgi:hypothetical protein
MKDLTKKEILVLYNFINKHLKYFDIRPTEEEFWKNTLNLSELDNIRTKLKASIDNA